MRRKRTSTRLSTVQVARILGITKKTLYRMLSDGRIPEPPRDPSNNYRLWSPQEVQAIQEALQK
jgi:predicted DNA-binding transcriptional regulator AlpA